MGESTGPPFREVAADTQGVRGMVAIWTHRAGRLGVMCVAVMGLTVVLQSAPASGVETRMMSKLVPRSGSLFGAWVDTDGRWIDNQSAEGEVTTFEHQIGRTLDIDAHYYDWGQTFPSGLEQWDLQKGRTPLISWKAGDLDAIASGAYDEVIRQRADDLKALGKPVFLRFAWEMNGDWYPWSGTPAKYVVAWRHVHDLFESEGADNVVWVWAPNDQSVPNESWNSAEAYYPGDGYVDWVAIDGYNWGTTQSWASWTAFPALFQSTYRDFSDRKPIMIAETGSVSQGGSKAAWIQGARNSIKDRFPDIAAFVYFEAPGWLVVGEPGPMTAFKAMAADRYFGGTGRWSRKMRFKLTTVAASPLPLRRSSRISFAVNRRATISVRIKDAHGRVIRHRLRRVIFKAGKWGVRWRGLNDRFKRVRPGRYRAVVIAHDSRGRHHRARAEIDVV